MLKLSQKDILKKYAKKIAVQDYSKKPVIDGVQIVELKNFTSEDGYFLEVLRSGDDGKVLGFPHFQIQQVSYSQVIPGGIKAWHIHYNQEDLWFIPPESSALVGLVDLRKKSKTKDIKMRFSLGEHKSHLLFIPRGVAHGIANVSNSPITMVYFLNQQFNLENPDERRLPWDFFGKDFWELHKG